MNKRYKFFWKYKMMRSLIEKARERDSEIRIERKRLSLLDEPLSEVKISKQSEG